MCLRFDRMTAGGEEAFFRDCEESSSEWALSCGDGGVDVGCRITPTPSLFAEPSRPIAMGMLLIMCGVLDCTSFQYQSRCRSVPLMQFAAIACDHGVESGVKGRLEAT